jgi:5-methylcytosine-specific restriction endonuclease McrA
MATEISDATRFAIYTKWPQKCVWCQEPVAYRDVEIDHMIPKSLADASADDAAERAKELEELIRLHGLPADFDVHSEENLAPSCRRCNGFKGDRPPPVSGFVGLVLERAAGYADGVRKSAATAVSQKKFQNALGVISVSDLSDPEFVESIREYRSELEELLATLEVKAERVDLGADIVAESLDGRWTLFQSLANGVRVVVDPESGRGGYTGPGFGFQCPYCGHSGPWNGTVCMACNRMSDPND